MIWRDCLKKLNYMEVGGQYQVKTSNMFATSENLDDRENINRALTNVIEDIENKRLGY